MICLDSDCIVDFLKGKKEAVDIVNKYSEDIMTTEINIFEIFFGIYLRKEVSEKEVNSAKNLFESINVFPMNKGCGEISSKILAGLIKRGSAIDQNDCFIASIMLKNGCNKIITGNKKHFSRINKLKVIVY